jgi:eukaryotic-like serine/threonine-protein kinase
VKGYELIERLSRGHAYDVYDAWSHERGCRCVIRMLRPDRRRDSCARRSLLREGRLLERLAHPHLVRAYETRERPALVALETLTGATLAAVLEDGPLEPDDVVQLGLQLGSAVRYLHRSGMLHLDLKPDNLIAEAGRLKLIDLSIAQPPGPIDPMTGTRRYMSPEQESGGVVTPASDVWGIGAVLREAAAPAPGSLADLIAACLRPEPAARPTVEAVLGELEALAGVPAGERRWTRAAPALRTAA